MEERKKLEDKKRNSIKIDDKNIIKIDEGTLNLKRSIKEWKMSHKRPKSEFVQYIKRKRERNPLVPYSSFEINLNNIDDDYEYSGGYASASIEKKESGKKGRQSLIEEAYLELASIKIKRGMIFVDQEKFEDAKAKYKEALASYELLAKQHPEVYLSNVADVQERLGSIYFSLNRMEDAEISYKAALDIYNEIAPKHPNAYSTNVSTILNELGIIYSKQEKYEEAVKSFKDALKINAQIGNAEGKATNFNNIGDIYKEQGRNEAALRMWNDSYQILENLGILNKKLEEKIEDIKKEVYFSVYAPTSIFPGAKFMLSIWAYVYDQKYEMKISATKEGIYEAREEKGPMPALKGEIFQVLLALPPPFKVINELDTIIWREKISKATFQVSVPDNIDKGIHFGHAKVSIGGIDLLRIDFTLNIGEFNAQLINITQEVKKAVRAFASYTKSDEIEVLQAIQGIRAFGIKVFQNNLSLREGAEWEQEIYKNILRSDIFLLFWSRAAIKSIWVDKEWRYAYEKRGVEFIHPVPLEDPDIAPPPRELESRHFYDKSRSRLDYLKLKAENFKQIQDIKLNK
ncbi:MAG: tetratricopeptide repeat protein [Candidatus Thorarchaeota archaeon]